MQSFKTVVAQIRNLPWQKLASHELLKLMVLSAYAALEFAESLRIALKLNPDNPSLREMADGELYPEAHNLQHDDYDQPGDHSAFLLHFIKKHGLNQMFPDAVAAGEAYLAQVRELPDEVRAMSIISRETELSGIFERILEDQDWSTPPLPAFRYYLARHIELDSAEETGHAALLSGFAVDDSVTEFYRIRLCLYEGLRF